MNIALEQTNEIVDGKVRRNYGDAFVRGNNGMLLLFLRAALGRDEILMFAMQSCTSLPTHRLSKLREMASIESVVGRSHTYLRGSG